MYSTWLAVTLQCICLTLTPMMLQFSACIWHARSQWGSLLTVHLMKNLYRDVEGWMMAWRVTSDDGGNCFAFEQQYVRGRTLSICLSIHIRSSGGEVGRGSNTVTMPRRADYCASLAPSPVIRYASLPLPAAIPLPRLPVPALECFCSILNRLIEQCSRERAACQSQLKTQKQKIKKAHGWAPALIKKNFLKSAGILRAGEREGRKKHHRW